MNPLQNSDFDETQLIRTTDLVNVRNTLVALWRRVEALQKSTSEDGQDIREEIAQWKQIDASLTSVVENLTSLLELQTNNSNQLSVVLKGLDQRLDALSQQAKQPVKSLASSNPDTLTGSAITRSQARSTPLKTFNPSEVQIEIPSDLAVKLEVLIETKIHQLVLEEMRRNPISESLQPKTTNSNSSPWWLSGSIILLLVLNVLQFATYKGWADEVSGLLARVNDKANSALVKLKRIEER